MNPRDPKSYALVALMALAVLLAATPVSYADDPPVIVKFETPLGDFEVELLANDAPLTVANFLNYVRDGRFRESFVHRTVPDFVIQGGGYVFRGGEARAIPTDPPVRNEPGLSNVRGTIAMAKLNGDPNSATSQWFINVSNNTELDSDNGGFTVFGRVLGDGMQVVDAIAAVPRYNAGGSFSELPLLDFDTGQQIAPENLVFTEITQVSGAPAPTVLLRKGSGNWKSYRLGVDGDTAEVSEEGPVKLPRSKDLETAARQDFDGDGDTDVLLRDTSLARNGGWLLATLAGATVTDSAELPFVEGADETLVTARDFDGDTRADILLRNTSTGAWTVYILAGARIRAAGTLPLGGLEDEYIGTGDFDADGDFDILMRRPNGTFAAYLLNGTGSPQTGSPKLNRRSQWSVEAIADFDGNGTSDVLMRSTSGEWSMYFMDGSRVRGKGKVGLSKDVDDVLVTTADFNGDGSTDVLLRNSAGDWTLYTLQGRQVLDEDTPALTNDTDFRLVQVADFNGDGQADLLMRSADGDWLLYTMEGTKVLASVVPPLTTSTKWVPQTDGF
jgi:cyclophilin family peptidyl-prolyl cis-trans isomerase